ncbi:hypothetical protein [Nostoc linckia]|uniref:hypothetical protein n=1 Tax=Nostoc linckia TaxID=92942 RepID=UPI00117C588E|nr:hypothetical protein [Nostoc linckia]
MGRWGGGEMSFSPLPLLPDARCPMPDARCPMPDARCPMPDARCPMPQVLFYREFLSGFTSFGVDY